MRAHASTRVAVIGLGAIAEKAYLPVVAAREDVQLVLCTRNERRLRALAAAYRVSDVATSVEDAIGTGLDAAFVHTSTESHVHVAERLLRAGVPVYVDKPIAYGYAECEQLVETSEAYGRILTVGFNRRFAPMYARLQSPEPGRVIVLQKNRTFLPDYARRLVFDDFIHVVDTLRFLAGGEVTDVRVSGFESDGKLHRVMVHLDGEGFTAVGLMNRDSGVTEETLEVMAPGHKWVVRGLNTTVHYAGGEEHVHRFGDWEPVLHRRGFAQIVDHFLACVRGEQMPAQPARDALATHALCERVVTELEGTGGAMWAPGAGGRS